MTHEFEISREADLIAENDQLRAEVADPLDQVALLTLQTGLAEKTLRQVADALAAAINPSS